MADEEEEGMNPPPGPTPPMPAGEERYPLRNRIPLVRDELINDPVDRLALRRTDGWWHVVNEIRLLYHEGFTEPTQNRDVWQARINMLLHQFYVRDHGAVIRYVIHHYVENYENPDDIPRQPSKEELKKWTQARAGPLQEPARFREITRREAELQQLNAIQPQVEAVDVGMEGQTNQVDEFDLGVIELNQLGTRAAMTNMIYNLPPELRDALDRLPLDEGDSVEEKAVNLLTAIVAVPGNQRTVTAIQDMLGRDITQLTNLPEFVEAFIYAARQDRKHRRRSQDKKEQKAAKIEAIVKEETQLLHARITKKVATNLKRKAEKAATERLERSERSQLGLGLVGSPIGSGKPYAKSTGGVPGRAKKTPDEDPRPPPADRPDPQEIATRRKLSQKELRDILEKFAIGAPFGVAALHGAVSSVNSAIVAAYNTLSQAIGAAVYGGMAAAHGVIKLANNIPGSEAFAKSMMKELGKQFFKSATDTAPEVKIDPEVLNVKRRKIQPGRPLADNHYKNPHTFIGHNEFFKLPAPMIGDAMKTYRPLVDLPGKKKKKKRKIKLPLSKQMIFNEGSNRIKYDWHFLHREGDE